jgi:hypothetical protein
VSAAAVLDLDADIAQPTRQRRHGVRQRLPAARCERHRAAKIVVPLAVNRVHGHCQRHACRLIDVIGEHRPRRDARRTRRRHHPRVPRPGQRQRKRMRTTERLRSRVRNRHRPIINAPTPRRTILKIVIPRRRRRSRRRRCGRELGGCGLGRGRRNRDHDDVPHQNDEGGRDQGEEQGL